jgi:hypothetical protein
MSGWGWWIFGWMVSGFKDCLYQFKMSQADFREMPTVNTIKEIPNTRKLIHGAWASLKEDRINF